ncbi:RNA polymerase, sigma 28 subunit, SigD/FliA/WhiG [Desulfonispora thiosulfatigenes DSM 11270]|uniref:RNA polymerase, sigma 28 subunit, SigD/FliA/WhiG n=1 Tax=Desulfonispora thiosulfatigenes DSM 11270 TaxID=656914 RepID=A0A1W1UMN4_DESTI|nr:FliA/WhiG family RNA polymerase sigma factor [Desulfonispora thiosulfatigenes]SMB82283.1 RNA polymerase, sigma 28 subunit, SigD/FliA/WhiG [Desulfonispora thiosulfatigenes DSM 11270]
MKKEMPINPEDYLSLVNIIVNRIDLKLPSHWDKEDMISYGILGLMDAIKRYKPEKEVKFATYASIRIRGAIIDAIRKAAPVSRTKWEMIKRITETMEKLAGNIDTEVSYSAVAKEIGISEQEVSEALESLNYFAHVSIEETLGIKDTQLGSPEENFVREEQTKSLAKAISELKENERLVLTLYFYEELSMKEIAEVLEVGVSRVSQIKSKALISLRKKLEEDR